MTAKEKAKELVGKYAAVVKGLALRVVTPNECALIAIDEILKNDSMGISYDFNQLVCDTDWWEEVKQEIQKL